MRLISCYIENFGKWSDKDISFSDGINSFYMNNGEGKTTLAVFIKAMFYGLKGYTDATKDFVERRHFAPFSGGAFGGNLVFEHNGSEYRIERRFHEKSKVRDTVSVFCNGSAVDELCEDSVGEILFSLDEESFARTLFITSDDMELCATSGIGKGLNGNDTDNVDLKRADELVLSAIKKYKPLRGNASGLINESEKKIKLYRKEIENFEKVDATLGVKYMQRNKLMSEIDALEKNASAFRDASLLLQKWQNYDSYISSANDAKIALDDINSRYPKGIPNDADIASAEKTLDSFYKVNERLSVTDFGEEKQGRLNTLDKFFANGEPSEDEFADMRKSYDKAREYDAKIKALDNDFKNEKDTEILSRFQDRVPSEEDLAHISELEADYRKKSARLTESNAESNERVEKVEVSKDRKQILTVFAIVGAVAIVAGAVLAFTLLMLVGVIVAAFGVITLVGVGFAYVVGRMNDIEKSREQGRNSLVDVQLDIKNAESELRTALALLGYAGGDALSELVRMRSDIERYCELTNVEEKRKTEISRLTLVRDGELEHVKKELSEYSLDISDIGEAIRRLAQIKDERNMLLRAKEKSDEARKNDTRLLCKLNDELDAFFASYRDSEPDDLKSELDTLKSDSFKLLQYKNSFEKAKLDADGYMEREKLSERPSVVPYDINGIESELSEKRRELSQLDRQISDDEDCTAKLDGLRVSLAAEEETLEEYKKRHKLLTDCRALLRFSDALLTERYIAPVKNSFNKYANAIKESLGESISLDRELNVSFEKNGMRRDSKHLSAGQRAVWALCLRLAFIDELFENDTPFLILDDPFVALDAENMNGVARLLRELANGRQMIYFTCHESRLIKE